MALHSYQPIFGMKRLSNCLGIWRTTLAPSRIGRFHHLHVPHRLSCSLMACPGFLSAGLRYCR